MSLQSTQRAFSLAIPAIALVTVLGVSSARFFGYDPSYGHPASVASRELRFADQDDGGILVTDAATGQSVGQLSPGSNGFVRATMRGLANARKLRGAGSDVPFTLAAHPDGALTLVDPVTGRTLDLSAFGETNMEAFARFLPAPAPKTAAL